jgi:steroid delta-isomerase-like uncharacterized protein
MSTEENKDLIRRAFEAGNQKNWAVFDALFAPDYVLHNASTTMGFEAYKQFLLRYGSAFPDGSLTIEDMIAEGDRVVFRQMFRGTHQGDMMGIPPTGKQITMSGIAITRVANGKIVEGWYNGDDLGMMQQLGVVPMPGQAG